MTSSHSLVVRAAILGLALVTLHPAVAAESAAPSAAIATQWSGEYRSESISDGMVQGGERFMLTRHPDGSRSLQMRADLRSRGSLFDVYLRVDAKFRPVSGDGWHTAPYDMAARGVQTLNLYSDDAGADVTKPVLGTLLPLSVEYLGDERVTVPAGTFDAQRFRLAGLNDLWVYGPDRLVVKSELPRRGIRYVLVALAGEGEAIQ